MLLFIFLSQRIGLKKYLGQTMRNPRELIAYQRRCSRRGRRRTTIGSGEEDEEAGYETSNSKKLLNSSKVETGGRISAIFIFSTEDRLEATSQASTHTCFFGKQQVKVDACLRDTGDAGGNYIDTEFAELHNMLTESSRSTALQTAIFEVFVKRRSGCGRISAHFHSNS